MDNTVQNPCGGKIIKQLWHCGWPQSGGYPGAYPSRYLKYMKEFLPVWTPTLHLFSGSIREGVTIDLNSEVDPTHILDLTKERIPYEDNTFSVVLADPPYSHKDYKASKRHYNMSEVPRYSFVKEAIRVLSPGGFFAVLHVMPYHAPKGCVRYAVIGVTTGTTQVIRVASIFTKISLEHSNG